MPIKKYLDMQASVGHRQRDGHLKTCIKAVSKHLLEHEITDDFGKTACMESKNSWTLIMSGIKTFS